MNIADSLSAIIGATVVVVLALGLVTYVAYRLRPARKAAGEQARRDDSWYFVRYDPEGGAADDA